MAEEEKSLVVSKVTVPNFQVREKQLGILVTNAKEIRDAVEKKMKEFSLDVYTGDAKQAAEDKAKLNAMAKQLNDERIKLEKEFMLPFNEFKDIVTLTTNLIKDASAQLDTIVKEKERIEKETKKKEIQKLWDSYKFSLVSLEKVFNQKWLNKTTKWSTIEKEIPEIIEGIKKDLVALDSFGEDAETLKSLYLSTLNLQSALNKGAELKANRERIAAQKAEEERRKAEEEARIAQEKAEREQAAAETQKIVDELQETTNAVVNAVMEETKSVSNLEIVQSVPKGQSAAKIPQNETRYVFNVLPDVKLYNELQEYSVIFGMKIFPSFTFEATKAQIDAFKKWLASKGRTYEKIHFLTLEIK